MSGFAYAELPSFQCVDKYEANFITAKGEVVPTNKETSHRTY